MRVILAIAISLISLNCFAIPTSNVPIKQLVFFGDSLSDNGNVHATTKSLAWFKTHLCQKFHIGCDVEIPIIPTSPPYYEGRFSNGPVWSEELANLMKLNKPVTQFRNYAYGGSYHGQLLPKKVENQPTLTI